jgi:TraM recognition site of TraD and TraG
VSKPTPIGITNFRNQSQPFGIKAADRLGHIYCIGKTGSGKSTLLLNMAIADIESGYGVGIIDPHGDLAEALLEYIPEHRIADVIYLNAADIEYPIGCNPFNGINTYNRYITIATIVTALKKIWSESWGPRMEHILRNSLLTLSYYSKATLLDIIPLLTNQAFRSRVIYAVPELSLHEFWKKEFDPLSPQVKQEFISPIVNKVGLFQSHPVIRNIVGQYENGINIPSVLKEGKILIANLSKGVLGEAGTQLLGSLLVTQFQTASLSRVSIPMQERTPFYLYIDEAHSFITKSLADILSESRKYGLGLFITHQFMEQLDEDILRSIIGNTGTLIAFRVGTRDAKVLAEEFYPYFSESDIINLPRYHIYLKLLIDGSASKPFSAITNDLCNKKASFKTQVIDSSRNCYGCQALQVEEVLNAKQFEERQAPAETLFG